MNDKNNKFKKYIGDGVYVDFDGHQISIAVNDHRNIVAYMEPQVAENFIQYVKYVKAISANKENIHEDEK